MHYSSKTYGHEQGFSCAFRQWRATHSHCCFLHGYALSFHFEFEAASLDDKNWVADFGAFNGLKQMLKENFDHKTVVASDDPNLEWFKEGDRLGTLQLLIIPAVGCEMFAKEVFGLAKNVIQHKYGSRVRLTKATVSEHPGNSASYSESNTVHNVNGKVGEVVLNKDDISFEQQNGRLKRGDRIANAGIQIQDDLGYSTGTVSFGDGIIPVSNS